MFLVQKPAVFAYDTDYTEFVEEVEEIVKKETEAYDSFTREETDGEVVLTFYEKHFIKKYIIRPMESGKTFLHVNFQEQLEDPLVKLSNFIGMEIPRDLVEFIESDSKRFDEPEDIFLDEQVEKLYRYMKQNGRMDSDEDLDIKVDQSKIIDKKTRSKLVMEKREEHIRDFLRSGQTRKSFVPNVCASFPSIQTRMLIFL